MKSSATLPPNYLESFAQIAEAVAATTKKLQKAKLLGDYFEQLPDEDLTRAARYFAGQQFAQSDMRTTNVGGRILAEAICLATGVDPAGLGPRHARWGDGGDVAFEVFSEAKPNNIAALTLGDTDELLSRLSGTRGKKAKTEVLTRVLRKATPF